MTFRAAETGEPVVLEDIRTHPLYKDAPKSWHGTIVGLPLKVKDRVVGVMNISRFEGSPLAEEELQILKMLADQRGYLPEIDELWSDALAEGEICDGPLLDALMRVAVEEGREDDLQVLFE